MTKNAKGILIAVLGVGIVGSFLLVFTVVVVAFGLIAATAAESEEETDNSAVTRNSDTQRGKTSDIGSKKSNNGTKATSNSSISPELVGRWVKREGGGETDYTGKTRYRSNRIYLYEISQDGSIDYTLDRETLTIMQCEIKERRRATGVVSTEGDSLVINLEEAISAESNSCEGGEIAEKPLPAETLNLKWNLKTEGETAELCLLESNGEACYSKQ